jgi:hypothetical protein
VDTNGTAYELGYRLSTAGLSDANGQSVAPLSLSNVDLSDAVGASLNLGFWNSDASTALQYSLNGGAWQSYSNPDGQPTTSWHTLHIPLALSALQAGTNTLALRASNDSATVVSGGDLSINLVDNPHPAPMAPMIPCSLMQLMMKAMPNMVMVSDPCGGGTPMPTGTSMPMPTGTAMPTGTSMAMPTDTAMPMPTDTAMPKPSNTPAGSTSTPVPATSTPSQAHVTIDNVSAGPDSVTAGDSETIHTTVSTDAPLSGAIVDFEVYDSNWNKVYQNYVSDVNFDANSPQTFSQKWQVPDGQAPGAYRALIGVFKAGWTGLYAWDDKGATFNVATAP